MESSLLILVLMPMLFFYQISEAQVVSITLDIADWTTVTEKTTLSVLGACFSYYPYLTDDAFCSRYRRRYSSSLVERISISHDDDVVLYNPSTVKKYAIDSFIVILLIMHYIYTYCIIRLEVTTGPEEKRSLNNNDIEDTIRIQSSSNTELDDPQDLSKANFFSPVINNGTGTTINYNIQSLFAFFRPFLDAWSGMVGATSTFFNTIKLTHTTIEYVKETTSTTTLLINTCNDLTIMNSILHEHVPKCKTSNNTNTESSTTTGLDSTTTTLSSSTTPVVLESTTDESIITNGTTTADGTSTTSQATAITDETTPVSTNSSATSSTIPTTLSTTPIPSQIITEITTTETNPTTTDPTALSSTTTEVTSTMSQTNPNITDPTAPSSTTDETTTYIITTDATTIDGITTDSSTTDGTTTDATTTDPITTDATTTDWITTEETTTDWIVYTSDATTMDPITTDRPNTTETTPKTTTVFASKL